MKFENTYVQGSFQQSPDKILPSPFKQQQQSIV